MAAILQMFADYVGAPTRRREPQGADFRAAIADIHTEWPDIADEPTPSIEQDMEQVENLRTPDARRAPVEAFDPVEVHYNIRRSAVELSSLKYEREKFASNVRRKLTELDDRIAQGERDHEELCRKWLKETSELGVLKYLEGRANPPALPTTEGE